MTNAFNLPSLFFGIYLIVPFILGSLMLTGVSAKRETLTKAQHLPGALLLLDAIYLLIRTVLIAHMGLHNPTLRVHFFIADSTVITIFALIPYTVVKERYPKWWMFVLAVSPLALIPIIHLTGITQLAQWSHLLPILSGGIVLGLCIKHAREADKNLKDTFANPEDHEKSWLIAISASFIIVTVASFLRYLLHGFTWYNLLVSCMWSALMIAIYVMLMRQKSSYSVAEPAISTAPQSKKNAEPNPGIKPTTKQIIRQELSKCIEAKIYLRPDLSIDILARECKTNRTYLATYLREEFDQNFYEYINTLRLQLADEILPNMALTQEVIALQCGFNSARTLRNAYYRIRGKELKR